MNQGTNVSGRGGVVAGLFRGAGHGERALAYLKAAGFTRVEISRVGGDGEAGETAGGASAVDDGPAPSAHGGMEVDDRASAGGPFFEEHDSAASSFVEELVLLGFSQQDAHDMVDGLIKGDALVTADAGANVAGAVAILSQYEADIRYTAEAKRAVAGAGATQAQIDAAVAHKPTDADQELQLRAERLVVNKQRVQHGEARVRREIVTEMKSIEVPVSREELVIERHAVAGAGEGEVGREPIAGETMRIPLTEEKVNITKETVVREEVEIGKRRVEGVEHVGDTVRHEELRIDDDATMSSTAPRPTRDAP